MIEWLGAAFLVVGFVVLVRVFGLVERSGEVVTVARSSFDVIRSTDLSDDEKEKTLQKNTVRMFRLFFVLAFGGAMAVVLPLGVVWACDLIELISLQAVLDVAMSPVFLIVSGILATLALCLGRGGTSEQDGYSAMDRALHRVAFNTCTAQVALADLEDQLYGKRLAQCDASRPVFITGLPRAGTTLLLECCAQLPEFASHCYRDMPFVLIPCLWGRFSARFQQTAESRERAHGDGMLINFDSPEALEEVLWQAFWKRHYSSDRIVPWQDEDDAEFADFFRSHLRKIALLRRGDDAPRARYVSKNNLNIARTRLLHKLFPESTIVVPFRHPLHHASSMVEQHRNFLCIHEDDSFASEYMRAIGHYDFGENLRPVDFGGWFDGRESEDTESLAFWIEYWVAGYRYLLTEGGDFLHFLNYEALCGDPEQGLQQLAGVIGCQDVSALLSTGAGIRAPRARDVDTEGVSASLLQEAENLHGNLAETALNQHEDH